MPPFYRGPFVVHPLPEGGAVPGWFVVAPLRHVEQVDALSTAELSALGPLLADLAAVLRAETGAAKVYLSVFAEVVPHLHVHVVARPNDLPPAERGARLFLAEGRAPDGEVQDLARRVFARLGGGGARSGSVSPSPWAAAMLSAFVCPGLGQLRNREYKKGLALIAVTLVAAAWLVLRIVAEVLVRLPEDPAALSGPFEIWSLAEEVRAANAGAFGGLTLLFVVLWVYSTWDAYRGAGRL
jgi:diadenosine tetraphosphate (Ap4A) HIT family hydrolase